ncbi:MAG: DUF4405 domain-containing protein [Acidobacteriota bacterium]
MSEPKKFSWKAFISFYVLFSFIVLALSGLVLFVAPPGRVANWSIWRLVALSKAQWQAIHTIVAAVFLAMAAFHLYFNWRALRAYLRTKLNEGMRMKREFAVASAISIAILTLTIAGVPPFSTVMDVGEEIKNGWAAPTNEPPIPHAEELTIAKLADTVKVPIDRAWANLERHGVVIEDRNMTVGQIAERAGLTPQQVYQRIQSDDAKSQVSVAASGGWGRKTVGQVCEQFNVPEEAGVARLRAAGFEASATTPIKDLAVAGGKTPFDLATIIVGPDATLASPATHAPGGQG